MTPTTIRTYTLIYTSREDPRGSLNFAHDGDIKSAVIRAQKFCLTMGYRYKIVREFIVDLDAVEQAHLKASGFQEEEKKDEISVPTR